MLDGQDQQNKCHPDDRDYSTEVVEQIALVVSAWVVDKKDIADHQQQTPKFIHLHGESMITMTVQSGLLLLAGLLMLGSMIPVRDPVGGVGSPTKN